jgi:hypothetical protein
MASTCALAGKFLFGGPVSVLIRAGYSPKRFTLLVG